MPSLLALLCAGLAAGLYVLSFTFKDDVKLRVCNLTSAILWAIYYALLAAWSGFAMYAIGAGRHAVALTLRNATRRSRSLIALFFVALQTAGLYWTWAGPLSLLPWLSAVSATYAYVFLQGLPLRVVLAVGNPLWLVYAATTGAYAHLLVEVASMCVNLWSIRALRRQQLATPNT